MAYVDVEREIQLSFCTAPSPIPKLFINGDPGGFLIGAQREFCRAWPNQQEVTVKGAHFLQEDAPDEVGEATARFVAKVLARQIFLNT